MPVKKYDFLKILKEHNKNTGQSCKILLPIVDATASYNNENNACTVAFKDLGSLPSTTFKQSLVDFLHCNVTPCPSAVAIIGVMQNKDNENLDLEIKILPSNKIRYAYLYTNYFAPNVGNLGKSCMRVKEMQKALSFYIKNNTRIVIITDSSNKIHARALLWDKVKSTKLKNSFVYLDRVYARSECLVSMLYELAKENKWKRYPSTTVNMMNKNYYIKNVDIKGMCFLPFMDTFRYLYPEDNLLVSSTGIDMVKRSNMVTLNQHTNRGYYPSLDSDRIREVLTGNFISKKDAIKVKRYDGYVLKKHIADIDGDYYSSYDNVVAKSELDGFMLKENSVNEVLTNNTINKTKAIHSLKYNGHIHKSNAIYIKGELYHAKDINITCFKSKWYHISDCFRNYDRQKRNRELEKQQSEFWIGQNEYYLPPYIPYPDSMPTPKDSLIPKKQAIIAYDLVCIGMSAKKCATTFAKGNPKFDKAKFLRACGKDTIIHQEVYCVSMDNLIQLTTGELIIDSDKNREYLKKFNNRWYIKQDFKLPNKNQSSFSFMEKK